MDDHDDKQELVGKATAADGGQPGDEVQIPGSVRPTRFPKFIGNSNVVEILKIRINSAISTGALLGHMLFSGPHGLGKTTLAGVAAEELGSSIVTVSGKEISNKAQLNEILLDLTPRDVLFIDELHVLLPGLAAVLYKPLEDYKLDVIVQREIRTMNLSPFTFIGATTHVENVPLPLLSRLDELHFEHYSDEDLFTIILNSAQILKISIDDKGAMEIACRSQDTPRIANLLLLWVRDYAEQCSGRHITVAVAAALDMRSIDKKGINNMGTKYMQILLKQRKGKPVGVNNLAAILSTNKGTLEERVEPLLKQRGLIEVIHGGRRATEDGYAYYGVALPRERR